MPALHIAAFLDAWDLFQLLLPLYPLLTTRSAKDGALCAHYAVQDQARKFRVLEHCLKVVPTHVCTARAASFF
jgi:hypothetical protein